MTVGTYNGDAGEKFTPIGGADYGVGRGDGNL